MSVISPSKRNILNKVYQGIDENIPYFINAGKYWPSAPTMAGNVTITCTKISDSSDVTATLLNGSPTVSSGIITWFIHSVEADEEFLIEIKWTGADSGIYEARATIIGEA